MFSDIKQLNYTYLDDICNYFNTCFSKQRIDQLARETKFIQRKGVVGASDFVKLLIFNELDQSQLSLLDLKFDLQTHFDCEVSREAIHKRFSQRAVCFMKTLLAEMLEFRLQVENNFSRPLKAFNRLCIKDSSKFVIPREFADVYPGYNSFNNKSSLMNIQYEYDLLSGNWSYLEFTKATRNDQSDSRETLGNIAKGDLHIRDLGYVTMPYLNGVVDNGAYFLNRLPAVINVYSLEDGELQQVDWKLINKTFKDKKLNQLELDVLLSQKHKLGSRMVIMPVPEKVYNERIRKATKHAKSKGCQLTAEYKMKARYNIFITNAPDDRLSTNDIVQVYRLRWQIELVFKSWKSGLSIHKTKKVKRERFECQLIARIIWALISWRFYQVSNLVVQANDQRLSVSILKFNKQVIKYISIIRKIITNICLLKNWIKKKIIPLLPSLLIEKKKGKTTHCQILYDNFWHLG